MPPRNDNLHDRVTRLEAQAHMLASWATRLGEMNRELQALRTEVSELKGKVLGAVAIIAFLGPVITTVFLKMFHIGG